MEESIVQSIIRDPAELKSLELLYDYTKFHIGVYLTLTASYITITTAKIKETPILLLRKPLVWIAIVSFLVAGFAGGTIVSSITQCQCFSSAEFLKQSIGPYGMSLWDALVWTRIEHTFFWLGLLTAIGSVKEIGGVKSMNPKVTGARKEGDT